MKRIICCCCLPIFILSFYSCKYEIKSEFTNEIEVEQLKVTFISTRDGDVYNYPIDEWVYIDFNTPLDTNHGTEVLSLVRITPSVEHASHFLYESMEGIRIEPLYDFAPNTTYRVEIDSSLKAKNGTILDTTIVTYFHTGQFRVFYNYPEDGDTGIYRSSEISLSSIGRMSVSQHLSPIGFTISPISNGSFLNDARHIRFRPDSLAPNTYYTVTIDTTLESIGHFHLLEPLVYSFRTGNK